MPVTSITSLQELKDIIKGEKPVVVNFWASWCAPCKAIGPVYEQLSNGAPDIVFGKVNIDDIGEVAQQFDIRVIPTFISFKGGNKISEETGADRDAVKALVSRTQALNQAALPPLQDDDDDDAKKMNLKYY